MKKQESEYGYDVVMRLLSLAEGNKFPGFPMTPYQTFNKMIINKIAESADPFIRVFRCP